MKRIFTQVLTLVMAGLFSLQVSAQEGQSGSIPVLNGNWTFQAAPGKSAGADTTLLNTFSMKLKSDAFHGFDSKSECNLYNQANISNSFYYATGSNWTQLPDPNLEIDGNSYTLFFPTVTTDEWQNQCFWRSDIPTSAEDVYDFSVRLLSDKDITRVVVKLFNTDSDAYFYEKIALKAGQEFVFYKTGLTGIETDGLNLVLDFGSNPDSTTVVVSDLVFQATGCDGTVVPNEADEDETITLKYDSPSNLWKTLVDDKGEAGFEKEFWYSDANWNQVDDPEFSYSNGAYTIKIPFATVLQWQAQNKFTGQIELDAEKVYDFGITLVSNKATKATIKVADAYRDDKNALLVIDNVTLKEGVNVFKQGKLQIPESASATMLILDFGGNQAGLEVTAKEIILQEHKDHDYNAETNIWKTLVDDKGQDGFNVVTVFTAQGDNWAQVEAPEIVYENGTHTLKYSQATNLQWQAQYHVQPTEDLAITAGDKYYYSVTIESNVDFLGATVKFTQANDDANFFPGTDQRKAVKAGKNVFEFGGVSLGKDAPAMKIAFDFGGCPQDAVVSISNIILEKMEEEEDPNHGGEGEDKPKVEGYTAIITPAEGAAAIELKGCTFDGATLTIPFTNVKVGQDEIGEYYLAGGETPSLDATLQFAYADAYTMNLVNGLTLAYVDDVEAEDPFLREEGAIQYANVISEGQLTQPRPAEKYDFTGVWETSVIERDDFGQTEFIFPVAKGEKGTITIKKVEGKVYITNFFGYDTEALNGGIPCKASRDGNTLSIQPGGYLTVLSDNEGEYTMAALYDSNDPTATIDVCFDEELQIVYITDFTIAKAIMGGSKVEEGELCYISCSELVKIGEADAIETVKGNSTSNNAIYTISGQRVLKMQKGLYIVNGQKVLVK